MSRRCKTCSCSHISASYRDISDPPVVGERKSPRRTYALSNISYTHELPSLAWNIESGAKMKGSGISQRTSNGSREQIVDLRNANRPMVVERSKLTSHYGMGSGGDALIHVFTIQQLRKVHAVQTQTFVRSYPPLLQGKPAAFSSSLTPLYTNTCPSHSATHQHSFVDPLQSYRQPHDTSNKPASPAPHAAWLPSTSSRA